MKPPSFSSDNPALDAVVASYLEALERGASPDREVLLRDHPTLAPALREFFADFDRMQTAIHPRDATPITHADSIQRDAAAPTPSVDPQPGTILAGRYKLLERIGEGGMGSVWVAEQSQPVKRKVAIKLIKAGMDSRQVLARFEAERQALAMMDHPNISKIYDGGVTELGHPYFVMEYVKGVPFTNYCDRVRLPLRERLRLFIPVCQAVQHAHQKGIVHRDLKPSNILVCLYDGQPIPKVIDFGLAKALHQPLTEHTLFTHHGQMVGTPLYMSPEQAEHNNLDVDTRTDIYSLGVVLYELLTGGTPLERGQVKQAAWDEIRRLICEVDAPRPSLRLSGSATLPSIAAQRNIDPRTLRSTLAGDLDWIAMKALDKDRSRRYETATGLARDIERFLNEEPVEACPPTTAYRVRKFAKRYRKQVVAAAAVFALLLIGISGTTWGLLRAQKAEQSATESEQRMRDALQEAQAERDAKEQARLSEAGHRKAAEAARSEQQQQRDKAEQLLSRSILGTVGVNPSLNAVEMQGLVEWSHFDTPRRLRIFEAIFSDPEQSERVMGRVENVVQSAVGLSPGRRRTAIELLSRVQRDSALPLMTRAVACRFALEFGSADLPALKEVVIYLGETDDVFLEEIIALVLRNHHESRKTHIDVVATALTDVFRKESPDSNYDAAATAIALLPPEHREKCLTAVRQVLIGRYERAKRDATPSQRMTAMSKIVAFLDSESRKELIAPTIELLESKSPNVAPHERDLFDLFEILRVTAPLMSTADATRAVAALIDTSHQRSSDRILIGEIECAVFICSEHLDIDESVVRAVLSTAQDRMARVSADTRSSALSLSNRISTEYSQVQWDTLVNILKCRDTSREQEAIASKQLTTLAEQTSNGSATGNWEQLLSVTEQRRNYPGVNWPPLDEMAKKLPPDQVSMHVDRQIAKLTNTAIESSSTREVVLHALIPNASTDEVLLHWRVLLDQLKSEGPNREEILRVLRQMSKRIPLYEVNALKSSCWKQLQNMELSHETIVASEIVSSFLFSGDSEDITAALSHLVSSLEAMSTQSGVSQVLHVIDMIVSQVLVGKFVDPEDEVKEHAVLIERMVIALVSILRRTRDAPTWAAACSLLATAVEGANEAQAKQFATHFANEWMKWQDPPLSSDAFLAVHTLLPFMEEKAASKVSWDLVNWAVSKGREEYVDCTNVLGFVSQKIDDHHLDSEMDVLARVISQCSQFRIAESFASLPRGPRSQTATRLLIQSMDRLIANPESFVLWDFALDSRAEELIDKMIWSNDAKAIARLLSHPASIGPFRAGLLARFEEIVLFEGKHVFLNPPRALSALKKAEGENIAADGHATPERRFRTVFDAADWIEKNWPEFDLETSPAVERQVEAVR